MEDFFQTLMYDICEFQSDSLITIFGDLNARVGDQEDFIAGVDTIPQRHVVDYNKNQYCDVFIDFLISTNMCILNGRNFKTNNFTSVSSKGSAVVDYVLVPYECLNRYSDFEVIFATDLLKQSVDIRNMENMKIPDHSFHFWEVSLKAVLWNYPKEVRDNVSMTHIKYDRQNIPTEFMCSNDVLAKVNELIITLEQNQNNQTYVDRVYNSFKDVLEGEMNTFLNPKKVIMDGLKNGKRRTRKPWWNEELTQLWNELCTYEKKA